MTSLAEFRSRVHHAGSMHPDVVGLKRFLGAHPRVSASGVTHGHVFCPKTATAVQEFQSARGLTPTGFMDLTTWRAVGEELGVRRFEELFFSKGSYSTLHKMAFGRRYAPLFPTATHQLLVEHAFLPGGGAYGGVGGGLTRAEVNAIAKGSRQTDTYFGHGYGIGDVEIDIPITLLISEAPKHAMTPEGMTRADAYTAAYKWITTNTTKAAELQDAKDRAPVPSPALMPGAPSKPQAQGSMSVDALTAFGKACHTYMDAHSPAHQWEEYVMPKTTIRVEVNGYVMEWVVNDYKKFAKEGLAHKEAEAAPPTADEKNGAALYMRAAFYTTFSESWFLRAVPNASVQKAARAFADKGGASGSLSAVSAAGHRTGARPVIFPRDLMHDA